MTREEMIAKESMSGLEHQHVYEPVEDAYVYIDGVIKKVKRRICVLCFRTEAIE